ARAARNPIAGPDRVARLLVGLARKGAAGASIEVRELNGLPALVLREHGVITTALLLDVDAGGVIRSLFTHRNPDKLRHLDV
ncbi:MAG: hypothetical protein K8M05_26850, partial [Deltaproteobacteria bacterium]|nr:hypothetical protein [Kofleriaceae bacterium]